MQRFTSVLLFLFMGLFHSYSQEIALFQQFDGRVDYLAFGNTLNEVENGPNNDCTILTESSANLQLETGQQVLAAYLYWAGSGTGDFNVNLNGNPINADRTFTSFLPSAELDYFAAFADVTVQVQNIGNAIYTLSELDLTQVIINYCGNATNFGGWAIIVVYEDETLPLNQLNVFDGFEQISRDFNTLTITLTDLETVDNSDSKIGFLAWEGDAGIAVEETISLNGTFLSNPPLNPIDNAFNGTNSFMGNNTLYNMDLDVYSVQGIIQPGDDTATITLTSGQDLVLVNNIITVLNNAIPDATIVIDNIEGSTECGDNEFTVDFTVANFLGSDRLPPVSIGFFGDTTFIGVTQTTGFIEVGEQQSGSITFSVPATIPETFLLRAVVDFQNIVNEIDETNNEDSSDQTLLLFPDIVGLTNLVECDVEGDEFFDLTEATSQIDPDNFISFHLTESDALNSTNAIANVLNYENIENPQTIWFRVANDNCFLVASFQISIVDCPLPDATITIDNELFACRLRDLTINYTVFNTLGTAPLPENTPISFYANGILIALSETANTIPEGGFESSSIAIEVPESTSDNFTLKVVVDDNGIGVGEVIELNEFNNEFEANAAFGTLPPIPALPTLTECDRGFEQAFFNFLAPENGLLDIITQNSSGEVQFFSTQETAVLNLNPIADPENYQNTSNPQTIYVRLENEVCFTTASFTIEVEKCLPQVFEGMSPNGDGLNDVFAINFLLNVFPDFQLKMYSRFGNLIYEGGQTEGLWDGIPNRGILQRNAIVPVGTYFYVLILNDPEFPEPLLGDLYINY